MAARVNESEWLILRAAASLARESLSTFLREHVLSAAQDQIAAPTRQEEAAARDA